MNGCVAHLQMNVCVAKNFGAWTEKVGYPCPTFMAHPTRVGRRVGALRKKLGHPWSETCSSCAYELTKRKFADVFQTLETNKNVKKKYKNLKHVVEK